jgi:hypothetical protein
MDLMAQRERELTKIYSYSGRGFFCLYGLTMAGLCLRRGTTPYFKDVIKHSILAVGGTFVVAKLSEKVASETYYNKVLINLADKYNFTPEEVMDLQRNLN